MKLNDDNQEYVIGQSYINIKSSCVVKFNEQFTIFTSDGEITLSVDISADMIKIPEEYREIFMNMLTTKYLNKVVFSDNIFSKFEEPRPKTWWQKFKSRFFG